MKELCDSSRAQFTIARFDQMPAEPWICHKSRTLYDSMKVLADPMDEVAGQCVGTNHRPGQASELSSASPPPIGGVTSPRRYCAAF